MTTKPTPASQPSTTPEVDRMDRISEEMEKRRQQPSPAHKCSFAADGYCIDCDTQEPSPAPAEQRTLSEMDRMLNEHAGSMRLGPTGAQRVRNEIIDFVLSHFVAPVASPSGAFSCAKRAADPGNEFVACRKWCGDCENCYCVGCASCMPSPARSDMMEAERAICSMCHAEPAGISDKCSVCWNKAESAPSDEDASFDAFAADLLATYPRTSAKSVQVAWEGDMGKFWRTALARRATAGTTAAPSTFDEFWAGEVARNGGHGLGADYRHWSRKGFDAGRATAGNAAPIYQARTEQSWAWTDVSRDVYEFVEPKLRRIVYDTPAAPTDSPIYDERVDAAGKVVRAAGLEEEVEILCEAARRSQARQDDKLIKSISERLSATAAPGDLPPLPHRAKDIQGVWYYTEAQMRSYGGACIAFIGK